MRYETSFKLKVVQCAIESNNSNAARVFGVATKQVREWQKQEDILKSMPRTHKANKMNPPKWPVLEDEITKWVEGQRLNGFIITRPMIRLMALKWADTHKSESKDFKATRGWCSRFMLRRNLVLRVKTKMAQKLPADLEHKILNFQRYVIRARQRHDYPLALIGNMDETPVYFDLPGNRTVNKRGDKTVFVRTTGHERQRFTVVLACLADGTKLPPMVIFKRKTFFKKKEVFPKGVIVHTQEKGWMDDTGCIKWINNVWARRPGGLRKQRSLLVWDMFKSHLSDAVKKCAYRNNTDLAVIPGGLTSVVQPLDVCLNKPFKDNIRKCWNEWMVSGKQTSTPAGNMRAAPLSTVCEWVLKSWEQIATETIVRSFKKCSISNKLDGTEDDMIWEDDDNIPLSEFQPASVDEEDDPYDDLIGPADWDNLFGGKSDSDFD